MCNFYNQRVSIIEALEGADIQEHENLCLLATITASQVLKDMWIKQKQVYFMSCSRTCTTYSYKIYYFLHNYFFTVRDFHSSEIIISPQIYLYNRQTTYRQIITPFFILNGTELLDHHLSTLFTLMLSHCYAPVVILKIIVVLLLVAFV